MLETLSVSTKDAIQVEAKKSYPKEACGFVYLDSSGTQQIYPCKNIHPVPGVYFRISVADQHAAEQLGKLLCLYHSHPDCPAALTLPDKTSSEAMDLPWVVISEPKGEWAEYSPNGWIAPLEGRPFIHGVFDCYALFRDYYRTVLNIHLPDFAREDEWWTKGQNLYLDNMDAQGFVRVHGPLKVHDMVLMTLVSRVPNHTSVYLGQNILLHHVVNRLSGKTPHGGMWLKNTYGNYRHKSLC